MSIRKIIDWAIEDSKGQRTGNIASPFYQLYDADGIWVWACGYNLGSAWTSFVALAGTLAGV